MTLFDKSLYLQRLTFAIESKSVGHSMASLSEDELWHVRQYLKEAEAQLDESIEALHVVLQYKGVLPIFREV